MEETKRTAQRAYLILGLYLKLSDLFAESVDLFLIFLIFLKCLEY